MLASFLTCGGYEVPGWLPGAQRPGAAAEPLRIQGGGIRKSQRRGLDGEGTWRGTRDQPGDEETMIERGTGRSRRDRRKTRGDRWEGARQTGSVKFKETDEKPG